MVLEPRYNNRRKNFSAFVGYDITIEYVHIHLGVPGSSHSSLALRGSITRAIKGED